MRLACTRRTRVRDLLDAWPALPLCIHDLYDAITLPNDTIAALKNSDRIRQLIMVHNDRLQLREFWAVMQVPFPELIELHLGMTEERGPVIPDPFLGGFAPRLRDLKLERIPFPGLPKLLLSVTHLVNLHLLDIPHSGYISPEAMVTCLALLPSLRELALTFDFDHESQHLSPPTRSVLPALTSFEFGGDNDYLNDLRANIDAPQVSHMKICFREEIDFDSPQLARLINRTPCLEAPNEAHVAITKSSFMATFYCSQELFSGTLKVEMERPGLRISDWLVSDLARVCTSSLPPLSSVEKLSISGEYGDIVNDAPWLELLRPFTTVKNLYLSGRCALRIAYALQELGGDGVTEVLPAVKNIFLSELKPSGPILEGIWLSVSARKLTGRSIVIAVSPVK